MKSNQTSVSAAIGVLVTLIMALSVGFLAFNEPVAAQPSRADAPGDQQFAARGADTCLTCHNNPAVTGIMNTPHGNPLVPGSPFTKEDCETCHGASPDHVRSMQSPAIVFNGSNRFPVSDVAVQNQTCLNCHQNRERTHWASSAHQGADLTCATCHNIHEGHTTALNDQAGTSLCLTCHLEKRSQINRRSHHPINEGLMSCMDCHNPHGSEAEFLLAKSSINETCTGCHAEKRGPFLWEHQPVSEDCSTCHDAHGSTQDRLLAVRQPFLCQACHSEVFHPSTLYSGDDVPPFAAAQAVVGSSCTNCHSVIHGSNHPSGSRLTR